MSESTGMSQQTGALPAETLSNRLEELNRQIASSMETAVQEIHHDLSSLADQAGTAGRQKAASSLLEAIARIDGEDSQSNILIALLEEGRRFASRTAFFLLQPTQVVVWASRGFGESDNTLAGRTIEHGAPWSELADSDGSLALDAEGCGVICGQLETDAATEATLIPFVIRGQLGGALYADRLSDDDAMLMEAIQLLTHNASQAVELVAFRNRGASPALRRGQGGGTAKLPVWQPEAEDDVAAEAAEPPAEPEIVAEPQGLLDAEALSTDDAAEDDVLTEVVETTPAFEAPAEVPAVEEVVEEAQAFSEDIATPTPPIGAATEEVEITAEPFVAEPVAEEPVAVEPVVEEPAAVEPVIEEPVVEEPAMASYEEVVEPVAEEPAAFAEPELVAETPAEPAFAEPELVAAEPEVVAEPEPTFAEPELIPEPTFAETSQSVADDEGFSATAADDSIDAELTNEIIPEPELEDTSTDIWSLEDDDEDEEPTMVGQAVDPAALQAPEEPAPETAPEALYAPEPTPAVEPVAPMPMDSLGQETVRLDIAALQGQAAAVTPAAVEPPAAPAIPAESPAVAPVETSFSQPETAYVPPPTFGTEDATVVAPTPPPAPSFNDPVSSGGFVPPPPEPKPDPPSGSNEVRPPEGHQGPGLAFSSAPSSDDEALHEEARRLARLLVSEIKLYNEEIIEEGKRHSDIYERLKDDIDRSRQMYQERIHPKLQGEDDYFYQELVQRLAGGDASLLGMTPSF